MVEAGYTLEATRGTATTLYDAGIKCSVVNKMMEGRPNIVDAIKNNEYCYIVNTTEGRQTITDSVYIRKEALSKQGAIHHNNECGHLQLFRRNKLMTVQG